MHGSSAVPRFNRTQLDFERKKTNTNKKTSSLFSSGAMFHLCLSFMWNWISRASVRPLWSVLFSPNRPGTLSSPTRSLSFRVRTLAQPWDHTGDEPEHLQCVSVCVENISPLLLTVLTRRTVSETLSPGILSPACVKDLLVIFNFPDAWSPFSRVMSWLIRHKVISITAN